MTRVLRTAFAAVAALGLAAGAATAGGISPGVQSGGKGVLDTTRQLRYVAVTGKRATTVSVFHRGRVVRSASVHGSYGVPLVTYDGALGGLSGDGTVLVLATAMGSATSRFAVVDTQTLRVRRVVTLRGHWVFDAVSPDGWTLFLIQYLPSESSIRYLVRAYDLTLGRLYARAIADKTEPGPMTGSPLARATSSDGTWVYTLYQRDRAQPFIHALNTSNRYAICLDLVWRRSQRELGSARLALSRDESKLVLRADDGRAVMTVRAPR